MKDEPAKKMLVPFISMLYKLSVSGYILFFVD